MTKAILLIGCGNMGRAMLDGWIAQGMSPADIAVIDPHAQRLPDGVRHIQSPEPAAVVVLAVKPQMMATIAPSLTAIDSEQTIVLSILASINFATIRAAMPRARVIVRSVPNLPAAIGAGLTGLVIDRDDLAARNVAEELCMPLGSVAWLDNEDGCHAATAIWGCGPAYVFRFAGSLIDAGVRAGLTPALARQGVIETLAGSAQLLKSSDADPNEFARRVASPKGVTLEALQVLDRDPGLASIMSDAVDAAMRRSREMIAELNTREAEG